MNSSEFSNSPENKSPEGRSQPWKVIFFIEEKTKGWEVKNTGGIEFNSVGEPLGGET